MGMPLDKAFATFGDSKAKIQDLLDRTDGAEIVGDGHGADTAAHLRKLADEMRTMQGEVEDRLGAHPSDAVREAREAAQDVIDAAELAADDISNHADGHVVEDLDTLASALDRGANYDWREHDTDPGGISGFVAHATQALGGGTLNPEFSGDATQHHSDF